MKKIFFCIQVFLLLGLLPAQVFSGSDTTALLQRGITSLTTEYNAEKARQDFAGILGNPQSGEEVMIQAYFWTAYSYLFEGNNDAGRVVFKRMFDYKRDPDYAYEAVLDQSLAASGELMRMYDVEFEKYYGRPRVLIDPDKLYKHNFKADKKPFLRGCIVGGIVLAVIIISL